MKNHLIKQLVSCCILPIALITTSHAAAPLDNNNVKSLTKIWQTAIKECNPAKIVALYDDNALLYATFSSYVEHPERLKQYFDKLCQHPQLTVTFNHENIRVFGDVAINSGLYTFAYQDHGKIITVPARYTFVYVHGKNGWRIIDHHSSVSPK